MRNRHFPRLCRACDAPMAGQEDECWRCGAQWDSSGDRRPNTSHVPSGASPDREHARRRRQPATASAAAKD
jgi:predicted amidophosphoribosyltransferase